MGTHLEKINLYTYFILLSRINSKWIKDLNVKYEMF